MEEKLKHLDYLQNNVSRMNQCSFQTKGLEIAIIAALLAIYATSISAEKPAGNAIFIFVAVIPSLLFWVLDSYYLAKERDYRKLYDLVADLEQSEKEIKPFCLDTSVLVDEQSGFFKTMWSVTEVSLYGSIVAGLFIFGFLIQFVF